VEVRDHVKLDYATTALRTAIRLADEERARIDGDAARLKKLGMTELVVMAEKRWNALSCEVGWLRRMVESIERDGRLELES
jgi:hypothetical protein